MWLGSLAKQFNFMNRDDYDKVAYKKYNAYCYLIGTFYENQNALPDGQETASCLWKEKRVGDNQLS